MEKIKKKDDIKKNQRQPKKMEDKLKELKTT
jgi:hypothetical protein